MVLLRRWIRRGLQTLWNRSVHRNGAPLDIRLDTRLLCDSFASQIDNREWPDRVSTLEGSDVGFSGSLRGSSIAGVLYSQPGHSTGLMTVSHPTIASSRRDVQRTGINNKANDRREVRSQPLACSRSPETTPVRADFFALPPTPPTSTFRLSQPDITSPSILAFGEAALARDEDTT